MSDFAQNSFGWQRQQLQQRFGEWLEFVLRGDPDGEPSASPRSLPTFDWFTSPFWQWVSKALAWGIVIAIAIWVLWQLWRWLEPYTARDRPGGERLRAAPASTVKPRSPGRWLASAQRFQSQGDYRRACFCLYEGMLQRLHDTGKVPQLASRTDGEYTRAVAALSNPSPYRTLLRTHEDLHFGGAEATAERYAACRDAYQDL